VKRKTLQISVCATFFALTAVMGWMPGVFFLPAVLAAVLFSYIGALLAGTAFGLVSLTYAFLMPSSPVALLFIMYPWLAIVPRILAALGAAGACRLAKLFFKEDGRAKTVIPAAIAGLAGAVFNTVLVLGSAWLVYGGTTEWQNVSVILTTVILFNAVLEVVALTVVMPPLTLTLKRVFKPILKETL